MVSSRCKALCRRCRGKMRYETYRSLIFMGVCFLSSFTILLFSMMIYVSAVLISGGPESVILIPLLVATGSSLTVMFLSARSIIRLAGFTSETESQEGYVLNRGEEIIVDEMIGHGGRIMQSRLVSGSGLSRATVSRLVADLEKKGIISKTRKGVTNELILEKWK